MEKTAVSGSNPRRPISSSNSAIMPPRHRPPVRRRALGDRRELAPGPILLGRDAHQGGGLFVPMEE
jgi:hypothetical protein